MLPVYRNYAPNPADAEYLLRAGSVIEDIGTTVVRNVYRDNDGLKWFERRATNSCIPEKLLPEFRTMINAEGQKFLEHVDAWMTSREDQAETETTIRVGLGMYLIESPKTRE